MEGRGAEWEGYVEGRGMLGKEVHVEGQRVLGGKCWPWVHMMPMLALCKSGPAWRSPRLVVSIGLQLEI